MSSITLDQIISYLSNKPIQKGGKQKDDKKEAKELKHSAVLKKYNIASLGKNSKFFKNIFDDNLYRLGITQTWKTIKEELNISLYSSVLYSLDEIFSLLSETEQLTYIDNLVNKFLDMDFNPYILTYILHSP